MTERDRDKSVEQWLRQTPVPGAQADDCLDAETLAAWAEGLLEGPQRATAEAHASNCARCQAMLAVMVRTTPAAAASTGSPLRKWLMMLGPPMAAAAAVALWFAVGQDHRTPVIDSLSKQQAKAEAESAPPTVMPRLAPPVPSRKIASCHRPRAMPTSRDASVRRRRRWRMPARSARRWSPRPRRRLSPRRQRARRSPRRQRVTKRRISPRRSVWMSSPGRIGSVRRLQLRCEPTRHRRLLPRHVRPRACRPPRETVRRRRPSFRGRLRSNRRTRPRTRPRTRRQVRIRFRHRPRVRPLQRQQQALEERVVVADKPAASAADAGAAASRAAGRGGVAGGVAGRCCAEHSRESW